MTFFGAFRQFISQGNIIGNEAVSVYRKRTVCGHNNDKRSPPLDGLERRVSSSVRVGKTANSKRESVALNLSIITFAPLNRWGSVDCLGEA